MSRVLLKMGDCLEVLRKFPDNSVDAVVTDPPYGLSKEPDMVEVMQHWMAGDDYVHKGNGFMGKSWDSFVPGPAVWKEVYRVLKPGGHVLSFFGTRTHDIGTLAMRLAGFEIRDVVAWVYGSGFPKSMDISKAIDKAAGVERDKTPTVPMMKKGEVGEISKNVRCAVCGKARASGNPCVCDRAEDIPVTDEAKEWEGWGTALKPALEPITLARKPLSEKTVAANVLKHGTGAMNIDASRIETTENLNGGAYSKNGNRDILSGDNRIGVASGMFQAGKTSEETYLQPEGRFPANLIHDGSDEVLEQFPKTTSAGNFPGVQNTKSWKMSSQGKGLSAARTLTDNGSAARFFYCPKTSKSERSLGLPEGEKSNHPTVKPVKLMRYLCNLITPPGGTILDPYMGSGSTGIAAVTDGFKFIGIEMQEDYFNIAKNRINHAKDK